MNNLLQNGANLTSILTGVAGLLGIALGWLWRLSLTLSKHEGRLDGLEATCKKAEQERAEILKATQENAQKLAGIAADVGWLREAFRVAIGGHDKR